MVDPAPGAAGAVAARFRARMADWYATQDPYAANKIQDELKGLLNDSNAAEITQVLPRKFLEAPLGLSALERWSSTDRMKAVCWLSSQSHATTFETDSAVRNWIIQDPQGAQAYLDSLPPGEWKSRVAHSLGTDALRNGDEEEAYALATSLSPGEEQTSLMSAAILKWAQRDPGAALEQVQKISSPDLQETLVPQIAYGYAESYPNLAADWLLQSLNPGSSLDQGLAGVIQIWVGQNGAREAAQWVSGLPESPTQRNVLKQLITTWSINDPAAAQKWVEALPEGDFHTNALKELGASLAAGK